ncbi:MAG TPA: endolytic transglycosylase MltG, partial [Novosphingobium sp.]|nr:endolytic transglycosylase MltG [Novosphingobium sp.]
AAAGGDVVDSLDDLGPRELDGGGAVAAADHREPRKLGEDARDFEGAVREGRRLEEPHGAVPEHRLRAVEVPAEGSVLPDTYDSQRGESRQAVLDRMQAAMTRALAEEWAKRGPRAAVTTPQQALVLASIVEKETGKPEERRTVAGLYSNRLRTGMMLQADPTIIYPITRGKPLGRRIRQSEIQAVNGYNTYTMVGLPVGPITNPGRASIAAVLNPANTSALYMVADGTGGHAFAETLAEHNANVEKWFAIRRARGEM